MSLVGVGDRVLRVGAGAAFTSSDVEVGVGVAVAPEAQAVAKSASIITRLTTAHLPRFPFPSGSEFPMEVCSITAQGRSTLPGPSLLMDKVSALRIALGVKRPGG